MTRDLARLSRKINACRICVETPLGKPLPHEPRPVCVASSTARIAICGQAPGTRVHASGRPFTDPSGERLRAWMGVDEGTFYDPARVAIIPMGFCFPGHDAKGGDKPPRRECRKAWHDQLFALTPQLELLLVIGQYAQNYHLGALRRGSVRETVASWREIRLRSRQTLGRMMTPLPHPSWRNNAWLARNSWFETELLPVLRADVAALL